MKNLQAELKSLAENNIHTAQYVSVSLKRVIKELQVVVEDLDRLPKPTAMCSLSVELGMIAHELNRLSRTQRDYEIHEQILQWLEEK